MVVLDEGTYIASRSSWYRVAAAHKLSGDRRRLAKHPPRTVPEQVAYRIGDLWSWDITKLLTPIRGQFFEFYVVLDVFFRFVVGWRVEERGSDALAKAMFETAFDRHRMRPTVVHSDGGPSMTSAVVKELFADLNIAASKNRPRVSNDNPYYVRSLPRSRPRNTHRPFPRCSEPSPRPGAGRPHSSIGTTSNTVTVASPGTPQPRSSTAAGSTSSGPGKRPSTRPGQPPQNASPPDRQRPSCRSRSGSTTPPTGSKQLDTFRVRNISDPSPGQK